MVSTRRPREHSFPVSWALGGTCLRLSRFAIFCYRVTPLHVKITRSTNLLNVCLGKLKLSTYLHTVSYMSSHELSQYTLATRLFWVLASCGFCWITWRIMISRSAVLKNWFIFESSHHLGEAFFPCRCHIFVSLNFYPLVIRPRLPCFSDNQINKQPENLYVIKLQRVFWIFHPARRDLVVLTM